ncbi:unnamed protein product [Lepeophtheirus salmonis]|uniref:(salmon louse) hypothetical protein n=1 Tax=Lepeophtheirus salmonis TaxID=72036 RepID=A0A7R8CEI8_LEPSM|nr:unnamed protein product [Lepeophtheirus salmonis]CAF2791507.1 unnamed protein product [Lepeophtheirus salmonis]
MLTCCIPECRTGYPEPKKQKNKSEASSTSTKCSLPLFPKDENLKKQRLRAIPRKDFVPSKHSRVCSRKFHESSLQLKKNDSNVAYFFPEALSYLFLPPTPKRKTSLALAINRCKKERNSVEDSLYLHLLILISLLVLKNSREKLMDHHWFMEIHENFIQDSATVFFFFFAISIENVIPKIIYGLKTTKDLTYSMFSDGPPVLLQEVNHICSTAFIQRFYDINNILAYLKNRYVPSFVSKILKVMIFIFCTKKDVSLPKIGSIQRV